ncbi:F510_1955 family glycosylhydrolase [Streptomyces sp. NBC_00059]|uniref:F510_1955 family glycosylhydrolase n=1 Tax=Streptomyces sp. NBC_00059 TaxID=2975635 RepID=UPI002250480B|nr:exo-alpha-sialidase [Streptomyces sp. NBC_00059]MCX5417643.1 exo-alpha-sialidase [Streptomyces sp. NBC_00059]
MIASIRIPRRRGRAALLAAAAVLLAACTSPETDTATPAADPGTGHLHGLGVNPADGTVYAAGHLGVFRLSGGKAVRVADRYQDTMGFTVTGPSTFLASGHPSPTDPDARSPHLGLIRSTDAGHTWKTLSAEGEADFHALQQAGAALYGFDSQSGRLWASADNGRSWNKRAKQPLLDLAAHGESPASVWAATGRGLERSTDGGRTFSPVPAAPGLVAVDATGPGMLVALAADGRVLSSQGGRNWTKHGRLPGDGAPTVLTAVSAQRLLAADSTDTIYQSNDAGHTWKTLHQSAQTTEDH